MDGWMEENTKREEEESRNYRGKGEKVREKVRGQ